MAASADDIKGWVTRKRVEEKEVVTHVLIVCDTFDYEDYPVYVTLGQDVRKIAATNNGPNMTKLMEVYDLTESTKPLAVQLAEYRSHNYSTFTQEQLEAWAKTRRKTKAKV